MVFRMWRSDKEIEQEIAHQYIESIKKAENNIHELQLKLQEYEDAFDKINKYLDRFEEKGKESSNQMTDVYEKIQSIYEKDEINTEKIYQLENELNAYKKEINAYKEEIKSYRNEMEALERRIKEAQTVPTATETAPVTESSNTKSKGKKMRNIEFANQKQIFQQGGFRDTVQRVYPQEGSDHQKGSNRKLKKPSKSRSVAKQDYTNQYYPKDIKPARMTVFNPLKYS
jgi:chromosome segregation ATPase